MSPEEEIRRAGKAREILEAEVFKAAFASIEEALLSGMRRTAFSDEKLREKLCQQYTLLHQLRDQLRTHIETGKLAEAGLAQKIRTAVFR